MHINAVVDVTVHRNSVGPLDVFILVSVQTALIVVCMRQLVQ